MHKLIYALFFAVVLYSGTTQAQEKIYTLILTTADVNQIGVALEAQPYRDVANLIAKLRNQIIERDKQATPTHTEKSASEVKK